MEPMLTALLAALERGGPYVIAIVFAILYWDQRLERREQTALLLKLVPEMVAVTKDVKAAIDMLRVAMGGKGGS